MTREEFLELTEAEQDAYFTTSDAAEQTISDLTAERDSLRESEQEARTQLSEARTELANTKKLNFTLARQVSQQRPEQADAETIIHDMFKKEERQ